MRWLRRRWPRLRPSAAAASRRVYKAGAAIHHHGVSMPASAWPRSGLSISSWKADAARFAAEQEFGVGKSQAVGVGLQRVSVVGVCVQLGPGIGQAAFVELGVGFHGVAVPNGMDPPEHTAYRALIEPYFTQERVEAFRPVCERITAELLQALQGRREVDWVAAFALPFACAHPVRVHGLAHGSGGRVDRSGRPAATRPRWRRTGPRSMRWRRSLRALWRACWTSAVPAAPIRSRM
jgi:hypothetical protein